MAIGEEFKNYLNETGMSVSEAARYFNLNFSTLVKMANRKIAQPSRKTVQQLAVIEPRFKPYIAKAKMKAKAEKSAGAQQPTTKKIKNRVEPPERSIKVVNETGHQSGMSYGYQSAYEHLGWV